MKRRFVLPLLVLSMLASVGCSKTQTNQPTQTVKPAAEENTECDDELIDKKPVLYIYGYNDKKVAVTLDIEDGEITSSYPKYENNGWHVTAKADGTLESLDKKTTYPYLYWECTMNDVTFDFNKGFCFKGAETGEKLDSILKDIGLNDRERTDFITFWLPYMDKNEYNVVSFQTKPYTSKVKLDISPKPKSVTRVFMAWYGTEDFVKMEEQKFSKCPRDGMYAIEWGGCEVNSETYTPLYNGEVAVEEESEADSALSEEQKKINKYMALTIEENNLKQQELLAEIRYSQSAVYYKMLGMTSVPSSVVSNVAQMKPSGGHPFTHSKGNKTTYTDEEWKRLQNIWAWTGHADDMIKEHTVSELNQLLGK